MTPSELDVENVEQRNHHWLGADESRREKLDFTMVKFEFDSAGGVEVMAEELLEPVNALVICYSLIRTSHRFGHLSNNQS